MLGDQTIHKVYTCMYVSIFTYTHIWQIYLPNDVWHRRRIAEKALSEDAGTGTQGVINSGAGQ